MSTTPPRKESEMTTNQERAAEVIDAELAKDPEVYDALFGDEHVAISKKLGDDGLLMPALPEPDGGEWEEGRSVISVDDEGFVLPSINSRPTHPGRARRIAYALLAAADYAEQERTDG